MHIQAPQIHDIARRAQAAGKVTVLGGPSVSAAPEMYPDFDYLHVGELGDAHRPADRARSTTSVAPPPAQIRFETKERLPLHDFPIPAYDLVPLDALSDAARCSSPAAARIAASSATSRGSTAASRG